MSGIALPNGSMAHAAERIEANLKDPINPSFGVQIVIPVADSLEASARNASAQLLGHVVGLLADIRLLMMAQQGLVDVALMPVEVPRFGKDEKGNPIYISQLVATPKNVLPLDDGVVAGPLGPKHRPDRGRIHPAPRIKTEPEETDEPTE